MLRFTVVALLAAAAYALPSPPTPRLAGNRIVGGTDVPSMDTVPYQGSWQVFGSHSCGCVAISDVAMLTAGHCVGSSASSYQVRFGSLTWNAGGQLVGITDYIRHPDYNNGEGFTANDYALAFPDETITSVTRYPALNTAYPGPDDELGEFMITGWGRTCGGCALPVDLQMATVDHVSRNYCTQEWDASTVGPSHFCIADRDDGTPNEETSCNGDSGGPIQDLASTTLYGLTSWGPTGCLTTLPAGYADVSYIFQWVQDTLAARQ